jgi:hypothetical protein
MPSIISGPKVPKPVAVAPPDTTLSDAAAQDALLQERKRRSSATGSTGNIVSSLTSTVSDLSAPSKKSTLLGG